MGELPSVPFGKSSSCSVGKNFTIFVHVSSQRSSSVSTRAPSTTAGGSEGSTNTPEVDITKSMFLRDSGTDSRCFKHVNKRELSLAAQKRNERTRKGGYQVRAVVCPHVLVHKIQDPEPQRHKVVQPNELAQVLQKHLAQKSESKNPGRLDASGVRFIHLSIEKILEQRK